MILPSGAVSLSFIALGWFGRNEGSFSEGEHKIHRYLGPFPRRPVVSCQVGSLRHVETRKVPDSLILSDIVLVGSEDETLLVRAGLAESWMLGRFISQRWHIPFRQDEALNLLPELVPERGEEGVRS